MRKSALPFETSELFPERVNTEFIRVLDDHTLKMRVWERGSGETWACGTGACAAAVAAVENGYCKKDTDITVKLIGGDLVIRYTDDTVYDRQRRDGLRGRCDLIRGYSERSEYLMNINHNFQNVADSYLFSTIAKKVAEYQQENPKADIIRLESAM